LVVGRRELKLGSLLVVVDSDGEQKVVLETGQGYG